jgi:steroid 5-alpha reductase family enzyme
MLFGFVMIFNTLNFILAKILDDLSIVDITWGIMFIVPNATLLLHRYSCEMEITLQMKIVMVMVIVWGVRLAVHIGARHKGEDYRYKIIKARWNHCSAFGRFMAGYLYIFGMQGLFSMVNNASAIYVMRFSTQSTLSAWDIAGITVWVIGASMEVLADAQL